MGSVIPALFHLHMAAVERSNHGSATWWAAYSTGTRLFDERLKDTHDYTDKRFVMALDLVLPKTAGPNISRERGEFWGQVEKAHCRGDAVPARTIDIAYPKEVFEFLDIEKQMGAEFQSWLADTFQVGVDAGIHLEPGNHHVDLVLTAKEIGAKGFGRKAEALDPIAQQRVKDKARFPTMELIRSKWAEICNLALESVSSRTRVDHRSYIRQGIPISPGIHIGSKTAAIELRNPGSTHRGEFYKFRQALRQLSIDDMVWLEKNMEVVYEEIRKSEPGYTLRNQVSQIDIEIQRLNMELASLAVPQKTKYRDVGILSPILARLTLLETVDKYGSRNLMTHCFKPLPIEEVSFLDAMERLEDDYERMRSGTHGWGPQLTVEDQFRTAYGLVHSADSVVGMIEDAWEMSLENAKKDLAFAQEFLKKSQKDLLDKFNLMPRVQRIFTSTSVATSPKPGLVHSPSKAQERSKFHEPRHQVIPDQGVGGGGGRKQSR